MGGFVILSGDLKATVSRLNIAKENSVKYLVLNRYKVAQDNFGAKSYLAPQVARVRHSIFGQLVIALRRVGFSSLFAGRSGTLRCFRENFADIGKPNGRKATYWLRGNILDSSVINGWKKITNRL